jgi:hypothetical protein
MALTAHIIGTLADNVTGSDKYTMWKVRVHGKTITCFSREDANEKRREFDSGDRIRVEGRFDWNRNPNTDEWTLQLNNVAVDLSEQTEDELRAVVDGTFNHKIKVQKDEGGNFAHVKLETVLKRKDSKDGEWYEDDVIILTHALHPCIDQLLALEKSGTTAVRFKGFLSEEPEFVEGSDIPGFYLEADEVGISEERTESDFWTSKPRGLANRKSPDPVAKKPKPKSGGGGGGSGKDPSDDLPF